jgi:hypothetical protein
MDILVPHIRDDIPCLFLPHIVGGSQDRKYLSSTEVEKSSRFRFCHAVPLADIM